MAGLISSVPLSVHVDVVDGKGVEVVTVHV